MSGFGKPPEPIAEKSVYAMSRHQAAIVTDLEGRVERIISELAGSEPRPITGRAGGDINKIGGPLEIPTLGVMQNTTNRLGDLFARLGDLQEQICGARAEPERDYGTATNR